MKESVLISKSKKFAIRIINMHRYICETHNEYVLSKQVLRSGTSIGANIAEASYAQSTPDFLMKLYIARKEAGETLYWLDLLEKTSYISNECYISMESDCKELLRLLTSSIKTAEKKRKNQPPS